MNWKIVFNPQLGDMTDILPLIVKIESFRLSILKLPIPPGLAKSVNQINIVRQIKGTTGIEGNTLSEEQISTIIASPDPKNTGVSKVNLEEREARNALAVIEYIKEHAKNNGHFITEDFIKTLHLINTDGCDYPDNIPGQYRHHQNRAGEYHPPAPNEIPEIMKEFLELINHRKIVDGCGPLVRAILAHFYLVTIHPFGDGNGRTSRALEAYILYKSGYNTRGFYSLANFYYKNRAHYVEELQKARFYYNGELINFVKFSLEGFVEELSGVQSIILEFYTRLGFESYLNELLNDNDINARIFNLLLYMIRTRENISLNEFRTRRHPLIMSLYEKITSEKTVLRDIKLMTEMELAIIEDGKIKANIDIMCKFLQ